MKHLVISFIVSSILLGCICAESIHDEACNKIQKASVALCLDKSTLGFCMKVADEWRAIEAATCDSRLCCNAKLMGCTMNADCQSDLTTSSTEQPAVTVNACVAGQLKKHDSDCSRYHYCSNKKWVEGVCSTGVFNENLMSCVFGSCNNNNNA